MGESHVALASRLDDGRWRTFPDSQGIGCSFLFSTYPWHSFLERAKVAVQSGVDGLVLDVVQFAGGKPLDWRAIKSTNRILEGSSLGQTGDPESQSPFIKQL